MARHNPHGPPCGHRECKYLPNCRFQLHGGTCTCYQCLVRHQASMQLGKACPVGTCIWCESAARNEASHHYNDSHDEEEQCTCSSCELLHSRAKKHGKECPVEQCVWCETDHRLRKQGRGTCVCSKCARRHQRAEEDGVECTMRNCIWCAQEGDERYSNEDEDYEESIWSSGRSGRSSSSGRSKCSGSERRHCMKVCKYYPCCGHYCASKKCKKNTHKYAAQRVCANGVSGLDLGYY